MWFAKLVGIIIAMGATRGYALKPDEQVTCFPTFGVRASDGERVVVNIHAWVYELEESSITRKVLLKLFSKQLGIGAELEETQLYRERARLFLVDNERGKRLSLKVGGRIAAIGPTMPNGHIYASLSYKESELTVTKDTNGQHRIDVEVLESDSGPIRARCSVNLIEPIGVSLISDIDDTIKVSDVTNRKELLANSFVREYQSVPRMSEVYQEIQKWGVAFHYVSASPWQLGGPLMKFFNARKFPEGSLSLKTFRWKDSSFFDLFAKSSSIKAPAIEKILHDFPSRKFILVGDTGEEDGELYSSLASRYPQQVVGIFLRNSTGVDPLHHQWTKVFSELKGVATSIFSNPEELRDQVERIVKNE